uniref:Uncharacterized protein n=1 Tax=Anguilla anguilla TaxID=7936 RepID=A0A0E9PR84_ANGAN
MAPSREKEDACKERNRSLLCFHQSRNAKAVPILSLIFNQWPRGAT